MPELCENRIEKIQIVMFTNDVMGIPMDYNFLWISFTATDPEKLCE